MYNLSKLSIPFNIVTGGAEVVLLSVAPYYAYADGQKTDSMLGYKYGVVDMKNFDKFTVKVPSKAPVITQEQLDASKERIKVTFENAIAKPYRINGGDYDLSITANGINLIK